MRFLLKISILTLVFQFVLGGSNFYKQEQERKKKEEIIRREKIDIENRLRKFCSVVENYNIERCVNLRFKDAELVETKRVEAQRISDANQSWKNYCQKNIYDHVCMDKFGIPNTFLGWVFYIFKIIFTILSVILLSIPFLFLFGLVSLSMKHAK